MKGFKSIFVSSKHKINCFLIQEKYFQTANAVDTLPLNIGCLTIIYHILKGNNDNVNLKNTAQMPQIESTFRAILFDRSK